MDHYPSSKDKIREWVKEHQKNQKLTSAELGDLFANYLGDSLYTCVFEYHLQVVEDDEIKDFIQFALDMSRKHVSMISEIFRKENIPIPVGFGEQDIRKDAPKLFGDMFILFFIGEMTRAGLITYGSALSSSTRQDIVDYFKMCIQDTMETYNRAFHLLLSKGMDISPPLIPYPSKVDFIEKKSFISMIAGKERPLTGLEIKHLQVNINTNNLGKAMMLAFSQVASSNKLRHYFREGGEFAQNQITELSKFLMNENLPSPKMLDEHITDSTIPPFSDKLMLFQTFLSNGIGIQNYGLAIANMMRHDLHTQFGILITGIGKYANEGLNMMIELGWLEEPPTAPDREMLSKMSQGKNEVQ